MKPEEIKKLATECGADHSVVWSNFTFCEGELAAYTAAVEAPLQARIDELQNQNTFDAIRLRTLASKCGISVPESNEELLCVAGVVLGTIRRVIDGVYERDTLLQARIAQLEEALKVANEYMPIYGRNEELNEHIVFVNKALDDKSDTWLSEHDKEVAAKERERCAVVCDNYKTAHTIKANLTTNDPDERDELFSLAWKFSILADAIRELK